MIAVTQNTALGMSAVPLGAGTVMPIAASNEVEFWQIMALANSAVVDTDATDPAKQAQVPSDTADKPDHSQPSAEQTISEGAAPSPLPQFLIVPTMPVSDVPTPNVAIAMPVAPPPPNLSRAESSIAAPEPVIPVSDQVGPTLDQPPPKANDAAGTDVLPQAGSTTPGALEPWQPTAVTQPTLPQAARPTVNLARRLSTLSDDPNTAVPVVVGSRKSDTNPPKRGGADLTNAGVAGHVSKPKATEISPTNAADESPKPSIRPIPDPQMLGGPPKPDAPPSTAENAWRQKWISTDQPAVTEDVVASDGVVSDAVARVAFVGEQTTAPAIGMSLDTTNSGTSQLGSGKLVVAAIPLAPITIEPTPVPPLPAGKTTAVPPDATLPQSDADTSTVRVVHAKTPERAMADQSYFDTPGIMAAMSPTATAASPPTGPPPALIASGISPALTPTIVEMTKSGNDGPLELALSPEELGRVTISIRQDGDFVRVTLAAERPETLDLLRRHAGDLVADLRQSGFSGASLSFGQGDQGQPTRFAESVEEVKDPSQPITPETKMPALSQSLIGSGMDLRF
jgi:flagellar hook-length control protein FliK